MSAPASASTSVSMSAARLEVLLAIAADAGHPAISSAAVGLHDRPARVAAELADEQIAAQEAFTARQEEQRAEATAAAQAVPFVKADPPLLPSAAAGP